MYWIATVADSLAKTDKGVGDFLLQWRTLDSFSFPL